MLHYLYILQFFFISKNIEKEGPASMMYSTLFVTILGAIYVVNAAPASTTVNPDAITGTTCTDPSTCVLCYHMV